MRETFEGGARKFVPIADIIVLARKHSSVIPAQYFVATAQHESSFTTNEVDYEPPDADGHIYISKGLFQISDKEAASVGMHGADLLDPDISTHVFAKLQESRLAILRNHIPSAAVNFPGLWGYLAVAHNEGLGTYKMNGRGALGTIYTHGMVWGDVTVPAAKDHPDTYRYRNHARGGIVAYGDDCITGGKYWPSAAQLDKDK